MITFNKAQSIMLWFHIPMWIAVSFVVIIIGAYHAGIRNAEAKQSEVRGFSAALPIMTLEQLQEIPVIKTRKL